MTGGAGAPPARSRARTAPPPKRFLPRENWNKIDQIINSHSGPPPDLGYGDALDYVAGYVVVDDLSERNFQNERGGSWDRGKGCDIITTGTPPGVGMGMKPPQFLNEGNVIELGIDKLGRQKHVVHRWDASL